jgi:predicted MPP superfamily phosphohydrolase
VKRRITIAAASVGVLVVALAVYGVALEPRVILEERRVEAQLPGLPDAWDGAEIAVFSDLQVGMWWDNVDMVERVVDRVVDLDPAATLLVGDFVYGSTAVAENAATVGDLLQPLTDAGIPAYAVLGNHDHASGGAGEVRARLEAAGVVVLQNESVALDPPERDGARLHVVGLGATRPGLTDVEAALAGVPADAPRIVMLHNPAAFPRLPAGSAPFAVAGHTHCGQIALPRTPEWSYLALTEDDEVVVDGFAPADHGEPGNTLFVTCGIGFSLIPARINAPPQLVVVTLLSAT